MENKQKFAVFFSNASKGRRWGAVLSWLAAMALVIAMVVPGFSMKSQLSDLLDPLLADDSAYEQMISEVSDSLPEGTEAIAPLLAGQNTSILSYLIKYDGVVHAYETIHNEGTEPSSGNWAGIALFVLLILFIACNIIFSVCTMNLLSFLMTVGAVAEIILIYLLRFRMVFAAIWSTEDPDLALTVSYPIHIALIITLAAAAILQIVGLVLHYSLQDMEMDNDEYNWSNGETEGRDLETGLVDEDEPTAAVPEEAAAVLVQLNTGKTFSIRNNSQVILGKGSQADIIIANPVISRMHAKIVCRNSKCMLEDMGSKNGTFLNEQQLKPGVPVVLSNGVYVTLGNEVLEFKA